MYDIVRRKPILTWTGFDDVRSLDHKVRYLMDNDFGGAMLFSSAYDDFQNQCFQLKYPLMRVINFHLNKRIQVDYPNPDKIFWLPNEEHEKYLGSTFAEKLGLLNAGTDNGNLKIFDLCHFD